MSMEIVLEGDKGTSHPTPGQAAIESVVGMRLGEVLDHCTLEQRRRCGSQLCCLAALQVDEREPVGSEWQPWTSVFDGTTHDSQVTVYQPTTTLSVGCGRKDADCEQHIATLTGVVERIIDVSVEAVNDARVAAERISQTRDHMLAARLSALRRRDQQITRDVVRRAGDTIIDQARASLGYLPDGCT